MKGEPFSAVTPEQIEALNLNRILLICIAGLILETINVANPSFWRQPSLWGGAIYIAALSAVFLVIVLWIKKKGSWTHYRALNNSFWILFSIGFFPFLVRDAGSSMPLNCAILGGALICAPLLEARDLGLVFFSDLAVNLVAVIYAGTLFDIYSVEIIAITLGYYFMARNLHGRYFRLLDDQRRQYGAYLESELAQESLRHSLEKERDANAAKNRFLSLMSHDLRTPLNGVIGLAELARDPSLSRQQMEDYLVEIGYSGQYLLDMVSDVLDMTRIESDTLVLHDEDYELGEFIQTVEGIIGVMAREKGVAFSIRQLSPKVGTGWIRTDKSRFNQIFVNLLTNAVKFTPAGGQVELVIQRAPLPDGRLHEHVEVRDTGIGMSPEFVARALEPFAQEHEDDARLGAGLGLTLARRIVDLMGGTLAIDSTLGVGTTVTVELDVAMVPGKTGVPASPAAADLAGRRVLLCEDNRINAEILDHLLGRAAMTMDWAENGRAGLERFEHSDAGFYDAILMDVRMPEMDGLEATRAIRALDRPDARSIPIIAVTANAFDEDRRECLAAGMDGHVTKPVDPAALMAELMRNWNADCRN